MKNHNNANPIVLILAGGKGERFWPRSRVQTPKQLQKVYSDKTLLKETIDRALSITSLDRIYIGTNQELKLAILKQEKSFPKNNFIIEPEGKNTAPIIALASLEFQKNFGNIDQVVLSADAYVHPQNEFTSTVQKALKYSGEHSVLLGVKPTRPEIGYGYIATKKMKTSQALQVEAFYEKPNHLTALKYIKKSNFYWNPGIFIWKTDFIISEFERHAPYIIEPLKSCYTDSKKLKEVFRKLPSEPVDTAILEKSNQILMVPASFQWDDVGSWLSLGRILPADQDHNYHQGNKTFYFKSSGNISSTKKELVAFLGTKDLIVVEEDDILFVSTKEALPDIKAMLSRMKENKDLQKYLE